MGIPLKNPVIVGSSGLTANMESIKNIEAAGAGAIVIKSLFEEQVQLERLKRDDAAATFEGIDSEIARSVLGTIEHAGPEEHLMWTRKAKEALSIPVIASLNCVTPGLWTEYAQKFEEAGVDGLELNFYAEPTDFEHSAKQIEEQQIRVLKAVKHAVSIPLSVKLSPFYTNPLALVTEMDALDVGGYVLFNRFFQPDIDAAKEAHSMPPYFSTPEDHRLPLRYAGLLYGYTSADICTSSGIHTGHDVAKMILAGADCVQVVSALYKNKVDHLHAMLDEFQAWMASKGYEKLSDFQGKLSRKNIPDPWLYKRAQYVQVLMRGNPLKD
jgi:dihydroorotate dehydrogenase (fumarate)